MRLDHRVIANRAGARPETCSDLRLTSPTGIDSNVQPPQTLFRTDQFRTASLRPTWRERGVQYRGRAGSWQLHRYESRLVKARIPRRSIGRR
jgi:hypothetical protein